MVRRNDEIITIECKCGSKHFVFIKGEILAFFENIEKKQVKVSQLHETIKLGMHICCICKKIVYSTECLDYER